MAISFIAHYATAALWPVVVSVELTAPTPPCTITGPDDLRKWAEGKIVRDRLRIAARCAAVDWRRSGRRNPADVRPTTAGLRLRRRGRSVAVPGEPGRRRLPAVAIPKPTSAAPRSCPNDWLRQARGLLDLKRQIILQGVPGTGKTHVARSLARLLTGGRDEAIRLVQFHPAYSYEEFVEGVKVRSVESGGRHDLTYPVEDGFLCAFAAEAALRPSEPHVLIIDEINRGNLPRIFGELLYLLEYREQAVGLPYSRRPFRLPANLYLIGTMNAADRSTALVDQALRRRFSFVEMAPDASVLAAWLRVHVPTSGPAFADRVTALFERLNARLARDLGPQTQIGHSYFMAPDMDEPRLRLIWQHHVRPLLDEYFAASPEGRRLTIWIRCSTADRVVPMTRSDGRRGCEIPEVTPMTKTLTVAPLALWLLAVGAVRAEDAMTPAQVFEKRILPILKSPNPSSCTLCHLAGVDLKNYILPSSDKTFLSLRDQGLIDLDHPENSKILHLIHMGESRQIAAASY